jgi:drug/metabolite transporter (DMT)-like permease
MSSRRFSSAPGSRGLTRCSSAFALASWRSAGWVGSLSAAGSSCWFSAFALAPVALVRALGQVEVVFTLAFSRLHLGEALGRADTSGLVLSVAGVVLILAGR